MANEAAEGEDLIYAPDAAAMAWMRKFSKMVTLTERERCAALCEDLGYAQAAEAIRREHD